MPIPSEYTDFTKEDRDFMDEQVKISMETYELNEKIKKNAKSYLRSYAQWKDWEDSDFSSYVEEVALGINLMIPYAEQAEQYEVKSWDYRHQATNFNRYTIFAKWNKMWPVMKYAIERKALTRDQKKCALDILKRMGRGPSRAWRKDRTWRSEAVGLMNWFIQWKKELLEFRRLKDFRDAEVGSGDTFKIDGIVIHNSVGANDAVLEKMKREIKKATRFMKGGDYAPMKKVLYGHAHLVNDVGGHNTLGFYNPGEDNVYIRTFLRGSRGMTNDRTGYVHVLIHEFGHRCYKKFVDADFKAKWKQYYRELLNQKSSANPGPSSWPPNRGDSLLFTVKGKSKDKNDPARFHSISGNNVMCYTNKTGEYAPFNMGSQRRVRKFLREYSTGNYPSRYSKTNSEEFYCETLGFYLRGQLGSEWYARVRSLFGISADEPPSPITQAGGDEEKQEESENLDLTDRLVAKIADLLRNRDIFRGPRIADGEKVQHFHRIGLANVLSGTGGLFHKEYTQLGNKGFLKELHKALRLGVDQGKFEFENDIVFIRIPDEDETDDNDSEIEQAIRERYGRLQSLFFERAKDQPAGFRTTLATLINKTAKLLEADGITADISVVADIVEESLKSVISLSLLSTTGARIVKVDDLTFVFFNDDPLKQKPPVPEGGGNKDVPDTAPRKKVEFPEINDFQKRLMEEFCALVKGGNDDLTAGDILNSIKKTEEFNYAKRGVGRGLGKLTRLCYLQTNGKTEGNTIYKLNETGIAWCKVFGKAVTPKEPSPKNNEPAQNSVESRLSRELKELSNLAISGGATDDDKRLVSMVAVKVKKNKLEQIPASLLKSLSELIKKLNLDLSNLPLIKAQVVTISSEDNAEETITPLVLELRKMYVEVRKAQVSKRSLTILTRIALKVKEEERNSLQDDEKETLKRLLDRASLNTSDFPISFGQVTQREVGEEDEGEDDFPTCTEVGKIVLRIIGLNINKEESASSIRDKVNRFPDTNVTTKGLGRTMGALVRYGYLEKTGTSPSGTTYKGTSLLARWYSANTKGGEITDLGMAILKVFGEEPRLLWNSKKMHNNLTVKGMNDFSAIGVGRSMGKLARDGWLIKFEDKKVFKISEIGLNWYYNELAK